MNPGERWTRFLLALVRRVLSLRYRVTLRGDDEPAAGQASGAGALFLPNHPALIDPVIVLSWLWPRWRLRPLADRRQNDRPFVRGFAARLGVVTIPDATREGAAAAGAIDAALSDLSRRLAAGENILLYPSGHASYGRFEEIGGNSGAARLAAAVPSARIVVVRITGLWGSAFSRAGGVEPSILGILLRSVFPLLATLLFFPPRREVTLELATLPDLPSPDDRRAFNHRLESFYNENAPPNTRVPRGWWERGGPRVLPEPVAPPASELPPDFPPAILADIAGIVQNRAGLAAPPDAGQRLSADLGLDSLAVAELALHLEKQYRVKVANPGALRTVADLALAATGQGAALAPDATTTASPPPAWFVPETRDRDTPPVLAGDTLVDAVRALARRHPKRPLWTDNEQVKTYRDLLTGVHALAPEIARLPGGGTGMNRSASDDAGKDDGESGGRIGIMLPASGAALVAYYAVLWSGRTPVLFNWTSGMAALVHGAETLGVAAILTSSRLIGKLEADGMDFSALRSRLRPLETLAAGLSGFAKARALWRARRAAGPLAPTPPTAAVLFTSGSEALPKAVPLTHANLLTNLRDVLAVVPLRRSDAILGMLPPFHSFGLLTGLALPAAAGLRVAYHPNPLEGPALASLIERHRLTVLAGTPTFVGGILRAAADPTDPSGPTGEAARLAPLRWVVTGAEACPASLREALEKALPNASLLEGYGITECSPILAVDRPPAPVSGTVGLPMASLAWRLADPDHPETTVDGRDRPGVLWVRGPSVFGGYWSEAPSPFAAADGHDWYVTGDLIRVAADGRWLFAGRLKRFVKLGGEMVSLPAIEAALEKVWPPAPARPGAAPTPVVAVLNAAPRSADEPEIIAAATPAAVAAGCTREAANGAIRTAGLSGLHALRRVEPVEAIPLLGTGKTDYRTLARQIAGPPPAP